MHNYSPILVCELSVIKKTAKLQDDLEIWGANVDDDG